MHFDREQIRELEEVVAAALADILHVYGKRRPDLVPPESWDERLTHLMAKAAVTVLEAHRTAEP